MKRIFFNMFLAVAAVASVMSCSRTKGSDPSREGDTLTAESQLLSLVDYGDYLIADVRNPWVDSLPLLERYVLVGRDFTGDLPEGTVVRVPLESSVVYSSVHGGAVNELGAIASIKGVADGQYFMNADIAGRIRDGRIADVGNSMSPSVEMIVELDPDAILLSPFQNKESGAVTKLGVPVMQLVDYMEATPLGRAEWIKLLGALYGQRERADSIYAAVLGDYRRLSDSVASVAGEGPVVLTEQPMSSGEWNVPAGGSYMARMLSDAGGRYPWSMTEGAGSLKLDAAAVLDKAEMADFWLIRSFGPMTLAGLKESNPLNGHFKAVGDGGVYVCDTSVSPLFDEFPFHPERLLRDYAIIFHPALFPGERLRYFNQLK